jgi:hypothetical protein
MHYEMFNCVETVTISRVEVPWGGGTGVFRGDMRRNIQINGKILHFNGKLGLSTQPK